MPVELCTTRSRSVTHRQCAFRAKIDLETCIGLVDSIEDHAEPDRRTLAGLPLEMAVR